MAQHENTKNEIDCLQKDNHTSKRTKIKMRRLDVSIEAGAWVDHLHKAWPQNVLETFTVKMF